MRTVKRASRTPTRWALLALLTLVFVLAPAASAQADAVDDALKLPSGEALVRLEELLDAAEKRLAAVRAGEPQDVAKATQAVQRVQAALATVLLSRGEPYAALNVLESLARARGEASDRVRYAEALVAVARANVAGGRSTAAGVVPYLQDALAAVEGLRLEPPAKPSATENALRARLAALVVEAHYLMRDMDAALAALRRANIDTLPERARRPLHDLGARCHYARKRWADAAAAFQRAGNPMGAAAAWDAAHMPAKSVPLYASAIRAQPGSAAIIGRAVAGARFTGAHAALLAALEGIEVPAGRAGVPLLDARAELLEAVGRGGDAIAILREVAQRAPEAPAPLVGVGRLLLVTGDRANEDTWDAAAEAYAQALARDPGHEPAVAGLSFIAAREFGRLWSHWRDARVVRRCLRAQEVVVEASPDDSLALSNLGNTLRVLGKMPASLAAYARAREANPFDPGVESDHGLALSAAGRPEDALAAYERSLELDPGHLAGRQNAARALWLAGEDDRAAEHLGAAIRTARAIGRGTGTYRFLLDRAWRTRREPGLR